MFAMQSEDVYRRLVTLRYICFRKGSCQEGESAQEVLVETQTASIASVW